MVPSACPLRRAPPTLRSELRDGTDVQGNIFANGYGFCRFTDKQLVKNAIVLGQADTVKVSLTTTEDSKPKRPHQAFLILREASGLEAPYPLTIKASGKGHVEIVRIPLPVSCDSLSNAIHPPRPRRTSPSSSSSPASPSRLALCSAHLALPRAPSLPYSTSTCSSILMRLRRSTMLLSDTVAKPKSITSSATTPRARPRLSRLPLCWLLLLLSMVSSLGYVSHPFLSIAMLIILSVVRPGRQRQPHLQGFRFCAHLARCLLRIHCCHRGNLFPLLQLLELTPDPPCYCCPRRCLLLERDQGAQRGAKQTARW